jgi:cellulose biosynthesis protein BcsQ
MIPTLVVAGGADGRSRSTVALNLAVALSALGHAVELVDGDPAAPLLRALRAVAAPAPQRVVLEAGAGLGLSLRTNTGEAAALRLVDTGPTLDEGAIGLLRTATLVVVPLDAGAAARSALDQIAAALEGRTAALLVVLSRLLPRAADRWRLVDDLDERYADALSPVTLPMGRRVAAADGPPLSAEPTLYAPTGRAAKAYRAVARHVAPRLGLAAEPHGV